MATNFLKTISIGNKDIEFQLVGKFVFKVQSGSYQGLDSKPQEYVLLIRELDLVFEYKLLILTRLVLITQCLILEVILILQRSHCV